MTLLDISAEEIRLAEAALQSAGLSADALIVGDARDMSMLPSGSFDAALFMGPMYHILEPEERTSALSELRRVLKPQGVAIIAYLNCWGTIKTGLTDCPDWFEDLDRVRALLSEQVFPGDQTGFVEFRACTPVAALAEVQHAGFEIVSYAGAESFASGLGSLLGQLMREKPAAYRNIVTLAAECCELPQYRDSTDHLHIVARTPEAKTP